MSQIHTPQTGGARIQFFGPKAKFPRPGAWAWVISASRLGIIYELTDAKSKDGSVVPAAVIHFVKDDGTTEMKLNEDTMRAESGEVVALTNIRKATFTEINAHARNAHVTAHDAAALGYELDDEQVKSLTALQRKRLDLTLNDEDAAQALVEESQEQLAALQAQRVAKHPDAIALEEQIEQERLAFVASVEARRTATAQQILAAETDAQNKKGAQ